MTQLCLPGNALTPHVLEGARFSAGQIYNGVGTMKDKGGQEVSVPSVYMQEGYLSISPSDIPAGTWNAIDSGTEFVYRDALHVSAKNIIMGVEMLGLDGTATSDATATAADIMVGKISYSKGQKLAGTIPDRSRATDSLTYTQALSAKGDGFGSIVLEPQTGYYKSGLNSGGYGTLLATDPNFVPQNIPEGMKMFGVTGTKSAPPAYVRDEIVLQGGPEFAMPSSIANMITNLAKDKILIVQACPQYAFYAGTTATAIYRKSGSNLLFTQITSESYGISFPTATTIKTTNSGSMVMQLRAIPLI